jgi:hypothetical protein
MFGCLQYTRMYIYNAAVIMFEKAYSEEGGEKLVIEGHCTGTLVSHRHGNSVSALYAKNGHYAYGKWPAMPLHNKPANIISLMRTTS